MKPVTNPPTLRSLLQVAAVVAMGGGSLACVVPFADLSKGLPDPLREFFRVMIVVGIAGGGAMAFAVYGRRPDARSGKRLLVRGVVAAVFAVTLKSLLVVYTGRALSLDACMAVAGFVALYLEGALFQAGRIWRTWARSVKPAGGK